MRQKAKFNRKLKNVVVSVLKADITIKEIENIPNLKEIIYNELYDAVKELKAPTEIIELFEINNSGYVVEIEKNNFIPALEKAISHYEKVEKYEKCSLYKTLVEDLKNGKQFIKNISSRRKYTKRKNSSKEKEKKQS